MAAGSNQEAGERLRDALELFGVGESLMRQKLRRAHPEATEGEIEALLRQWLQTRPGAEAGDAAGRALPVPE